MVLKLHEQARYVIRVQGAIDESWSARFGGLEIVTDDGSPAGLVTTLAGRVADQAALMGILSGLVGLGLSILSVEGSATSSSKSHARSGIQAQD